MLRYRCLLLLPLLAAAYLLPSLFFRLSLPEAELCAPAMTAVYDRVPVSGTITAPSSSLTCDLPLIPSAVCVKTGDAVSAGDTVAIIDRTQSVRAAAALLSAMENFDAWKKQLSAYLPESGTKLSDIADAIPRRLTAPASGTVLSCTITAGQLITPGVACLTVADCTDLTAALSVDEADVSKLAVCNNLYLRCSAAGDKPFAAEIFDVAPAASQVLAGTSVKTVVEVTASLPQTDALKPGCSVYGYCFSEEPNRYLLIPLDTVYQTGKTEYVYLWENGRSVRRDITTDGICAGNAIVTGGLTEDMLLIRADREPRNGRPVRFMVQEEEHA